MAFHPYDPLKWERQEYYLHFINEVVCTYSICVELDITPIGNERLYPCMLWLLTDSVNAHKEFRTHLYNGVPGWFDSLHPSYTVFNKENKNFSSIWTEFSKDYDIFLERYTEDAETYSKSTRFEPKPGKPENCFDVSMLPWVKFTAFNINVFDSGKYLLPIFTIGKKFERDGRSFLPLAVQIHHAAADGWHVAVFLDTLQQKINSFSKRGDRKCTVR